MSRKRIALTVTFAVASTLCTAPDSGATTPVATAVPALSIQTAAIPTTTLGPAISRADVIKRAQSWIGIVDYYQDRNKAYTNQYGTYRPDCSGFVSMAWALPTNYESWYGLSTGTLPDVATKIAKADLKPGDMLDNVPEGHVVLFDHWIDKSAGTFSYMHETKPGMKASYGSANVYSGTIATHLASNYVAYRYKNIRENVASGAVSAQADGSRVFFADASGQIRNDWYADGKWNGPAAIGTAHTNGPIATTPGADQLFYHDTTTGRIGVAWQDTSGWHNSVLAGSGTNPVATKVGATTQVFYRGTDGRIKLEWNSGTGWNGPMNVGTATADGPITATGDGTSIFYHDSTERVGTAWRTSTGAWSNSVLAGDGTNPAAIKNGATTQLFYRGTDGHIKLQWNSGTGWNGPMNVGTATTNGTISTAADGANIFYTDTTGRVGTAWRTSTGAWNNSVLPGSGTTPVSGGNRVFFRATDGTINNDWRTTTGWDGPALTGGGN